MSSGNRKVWDAVMSGDHEAAQEAVERHNDRKDRRRMRKNGLESAMWENGTHESSDRRRLSEIISQQGNEVTPLFEHIFVKSIVPKKVESSYQKHSKIIPLMRHIRTAPSRRELGIATFLRNSTPLTRGGIRDPRISTKMLMGSMLNRQRVVKAAEKFLEYGNDDLVAAEKVSEYNRTLALQVSDVLANLERSSASFSLGERAQCFPEPHSNDMLIAEEKRQRKIEFKLRRKRLRRERRRRRRARKRKEERASREGKMELNDFDTAFMRSNM